jgi:NTE family protein
MADEAVDKVRGRIARSWQPVVTWLALLSTALAAVDPIRSRVTKWLPFADSEAVAAAMMVAVSLGLFSLVRFPRFAFAITRLLYGQPEPLTDIGRIFRGPRIYSSDDEAIFPGRRTEIDDCWMAIQAQSFLIIEGESGSGKSSLLNAGLVPRARAKYQVVLSRVADNPFSRLHSALEDKAYGLGAPPSAEDLLSIARNHRARGSRPLLICLDQFEELFVTVQDTIRNEFMRVLRQGVEEQLWRVVIVARSDFTDLLYALVREVDPKQHTLDFGTHYRINAFDRAQAEAVLREMLKPVYQQEPALELQLDGFVTELTSALLRPPRDPRLYAGDAMSVLPVEMQIVGFALETIGTKNFSSTLLRRRGGKIGLLAHFLEDASERAERSTGVPSERALRILRQFVGPNRLRLQLRADEISDRQGLSVAQIEDVLEAFASKYLVNHLPVSESADATRSSRAVVRYELMHDHLVPILVDAPDPILQAVRSAETRLAFWAEQERTARVAAEQNPSGWFSRILRQLTWQPVPVFEALQLLRYSRQKADHRLLLRSVAGFGARGALVCLLAPATLLAALVVLKLIYGSKIPPWNPPLSHYAPSAGYRFEALTKGDNSDELFVVLAFTGTGTPAAALAYGVLEALRETRIRWAGQDKSLLDEVDVILSNSGGSFPAAYYALYGQRTFNEFPKKFLYRDIDGDLRRFLLSPEKLTWLASTRYGRPDLVADFFDREVFDHRTYADVIARGSRPFVILGATDMAIGAPFQFIQDQFDLLCSDLAGVPLARAVVSSSLLFSIGETSLTFRNYAGTCGYRQPAWVALAAEDNASRVNTRRTVKAQNRLSYADPMRSYIHVTGGSATDITGLNAALDAIGSINSTWSVLRLINQGKVKKLVVIAVNSTSRSKSNDGALKAPALVDALRTASYYYSFDTFGLMEATVSQFNEEARLIRGCERLAARKGTQCALNIPEPASIDFFAIQVAPDFEVSAEERGWFARSPTNLGLTRETVDKWRMAGHRWLENDPQFKNLMTALKPSKDLTK